MITNSALPIYVINLETETQRWDNCLKQAKKFNLELQQVKAIEIKDLASATDTYVSDGVRAVWASHLKCLEKFLATPSSHALILEDDFEIARPKTLFKVLNSPRIYKYDLVQLGYLRPGPDISIRVMVANLETMVFRMLGVVGKFPLLRQKSFTKRLRVAEAVATPWGFTVDDFQPGAHSYLISRSMATAVLKLNNPQFLSIDDFFTSFSQMRSFYSIRVRRSLINQAPYPKWQGDRFLQS